MNISDLRNITIMQIVEDLGRDIHCGYVGNKYLSELWKDRSLQDDENFRRKYEEENDRVREINDRLFDEYMDKIIEWLYNEGYIDAEGRFK